MSARVRWMPCRVQRRRQDHPRWQADVAAASAQDRAVWLAQGAHNPHNATHFGQVAFKPAGALAFFEPGISATVGSGVLMEAHNQNPATLRAAEHGGGRFGGSPAAWLLQLGLPLLVVVAGYAMWARERESGTLRLQLVQGGRWWPLLLGKAMALITVTAAIGLPLAGGMFWASGGGVRAALALLAYAAYALVWVGLTLAVSAWAAHARTALAMLLASTLVLPRVMANVAERAHPSPSAQVFWAEVREAQREGFNSHNAADARAKTMLQATLQRYGVADPSPVAQAFFVDEVIGQQYLLDAIVTLVDAVPAPQQLGEHPEAQEQLGFADRILITKTRLVDAPAQQALQAAMPTELSISILPRELPLDGSMLRVAVGLPSSDLALQSTRGGNAAVQALAAEDADLDLCHVQPTRMFGWAVEAHATQPFASYSPTRHIIEGFPEVGVQVVQHEVSAAGRQSPARRIETAWRSASAGCTYETRTLRSAHRSAPSADARV